MNSVIIAGEALAGAAAAKPIAEAMAHVAKGTFDAGRAIIERICYPAAEEFGLLIKDRITHWRATNAAGIATKTERKLREFQRGPVKAHPRIVFAAIEAGSWSDDDVIQEAWAGIIASACTEDGRDDSNIIFSSLLTQLTGVQLRILNHAVQSAPKYTLPNGLPFAENIDMPLDLLVKITGCQDAHRLDRELDHLRMLGLIGSSTFGGGGGFQGDLLDASVGCSALALHLYVRGQGYVGSPVEYFGLKMKPEPIPTSGAVQVQEDPVSEPAV